MRYLPQDLQVAMALAELIHSNPDNEPDSDCEDWIDSEAESDTDTADLIMGLPAHWRVRDTLDTDVPHGPPEPNTITSVSVRTRPADACFGNSL